MTRAKGPAACLESCPRTWITKPLRAGENRIYRRNTMIKLLSPDQQLDRGSGENSVNIQDLGTASEFEIFMGFFLFLLLLCYGSTDGSLKIWKLMQDFLVYNQLLAALAESGGSEMGGNVYIM
ncbi:hypothetical protein RRG08_001245 [Elysia crispata]|uniref:Uncharacterized protein n=1 Tax=Elysia crispata TaxID=231223 RepID=A0AAE1ECJ3_9GAST|nr:hypothetical protein RRG08_001245 [Elysia crispata]